MSRVLALVQARVNSKRLPRKSLSIIGARASVFHVWKRAQVALEAGGAIKALVVVPWDDTGDFEAVLPRGVVQRGPPYLDESDVLGRLASVVEGGSPDIIVRLTADCPFVDPEGIRAVVEAVEQGAEYVRLWPIPNGLDAEAFPAWCLEAAHKNANDPADREHVTPYIRRFAARTVDVPMYAHLPRYRWTFDDESDLRWFREVAREIDCTPPHPTVPELLALLERRPDLARLDGPRGGITVTATYDEATDRMTITPPNEVRAPPHRLSGVDTSFTYLDPTVWV